MFKFHSITYLLQVNSTSLIFKKYNYNCSAVSTV